MELDDLKKSWQQSNQHAHLPDKDIRELIQNKTKGPVAQLKHRFRRGMLLIIVVAAYVVIESNGFYGSKQFLLWYLLSFCAFILVYFYYNYRLLSQMQATEESVKTNLQRQVRLLKKGLKWRLLVTRSMVALYAMTLEIIMHLHPGSFPNWQGKSWVFRLAVYLGVFVLIFAISKWGTDRRYKKHIRYLEELAEQMQ
jgi:hypothetical protein